MGVKTDERGRITLTDKQRSLLHQRIKSAEQWEHDEQSIKGPDSSNGFESRSQRNTALAAGKYWDKVEPGSNTSSINHLGTALRVKHTIITGGETKFLNTARESQFMAIEKTSEGLLNHLWDALDFDRQCDAAAWDSGIHPLGGVVELGWQYRDANLEQEGERPGELEIAEAAVDNADNVVPMMTPDGQMIGVPVQEFDTEKDAQAAAERAAAGPEVDDPFIERFNPRHLFVDPSCTSYMLTDARYVFRLKRVLVEKVKANTHYKNTKDLKGTSFGYYPTRGEEDEPSPSIKDDVMRVELYDGYTYFDLDKDGRDELYHVIFAPEISKEILCEAAPYPHFEQRNPFPFEIMPPAVADNDSLFQVPDAEAARDIQINHDLAYTQLEYARAHSPNVLKVPTGTFDGDDGARTKKRIESGRENTVLELDPAFLPPVLWMERPPLHQDDYVALDTALNKILDRIGVSEYQANMLPEKRMTATEAGQLSTQGATRQDSEIERYHDFLERCAFKVLVLLQQFGERTREYVFTDVGGQQQYGQANMADLRGVMPGTMTPQNPLGELEKPGIQFAVEIDASKKRAKNEFLEKQEAVELLGALQQYAQVPDPRLPNRPLVNLPVLLRGLVEKYDLPNADEIIPPDPTEEEIMAFQQQQQAMMGQEQEQMQAVQQQEAEKGQRESADKAADRQAKLQIAAMKGGRSG